MKKCLPYFQLLKKKNEEYLWSEECENVFQSIKEYLRKVPFLTNSKVVEILYLYLAFIEK